MYLGPAKTNPLNGLYHLFVKVLKYDIQLQMIESWLFVQHNAKKWLHQMESYQNFNGPFKVD